MVIWNWTLWLFVWRLSCGHVFRSRVRGAYQCVSHAKICPLVNISFRRATHTGITYPQDVTYAGEARHDALLLTAVAWTGGGEGISIRAGHHHHHHHHHRHYHHRHHHHIITRRWGGHQQQSQALCHRSSFNPWCDVHGILFLKIS